jgi:hypothetical protein
MVALGSVVHPRYGITSEMRTGGDFKSKQFVSVRSKADAGTNMCMKYSNSAQSNPLLEISDKMGDD